MRIQKTLLAMVLLISNTAAFAHCPAVYNAEHACMWLNKNMLYVYDHKSEHNGPYKDFKDAELTSIKSSAGSDLALKKIARGIFKLVASDLQKNVTVVLTADKSKIEIKVDHDK
jgi:hypothetical protein